MKSFFQHNESVGEPELGHAPPGQQRPHLQLQDQHQVGQRVPGIIGGTSVFFLQIAPKLCFV